MDRSVAGGKKVYFSDSGLLNHIGTVTSGQILENTVVNQLKNLGKISFYKQRNESEIDIIYENEIAFEIKNKGTSKDLQKLDTRCKKLGISRAYIISYEWSDDPRIIPAMNL